MKEDSGSTLQTQLNERHDNSFATKNAAFVKPILRLDNNSCFCPHWIQPSLWYCGADTTL